MFIGGGSYLTNLSFEANGREGSGAHEPGRVAAPHKTFALGLQILAPLRGTRIKFDQ